MAEDGTKRVMQQRLNKARLSLVNCRANINYFEEIVDTRIREINRIKREAYEQGIELE